MDARATRAEADASFQLRQIRRTAAVPAPLRTVQSAASAPEPGLPID
jgi:hypothetical protein